MSARVRVSSGPVLLTAELFSAWLKPHQHPLCERRTLPTCYLRRPCEFLGPCCGATALWKSVAIASPALAPNRQAGERLQHLQLAPRQPHVLNTFPLRRIQHGYAADRGGKLTICPANCLRRAVSFRVVPLATRNESCSTLCLRCCSLLLYSAHCCTLLTCLSLRLPRSIRGLPSNPVFSRRVGPQFRLVY